MMAKMLRQAQHDTERMEVRQKSISTSIGAIELRTLLFKPAMYHILCKINLGEVVMRNGAQRNEAFERSKGLQ